MIYRAVAEKILRNLSFFSVVGIVGPRQVGKTTLVKWLQTLINKPAIYLDLQLNSDLLKLEDAEFYLTQHEDKCVIIDEIQLKPELFALLRALIDRNRKPARFIILGSASPELIRKSTETLAGRISYIELTPIGLSELPAEITMTQHWFRGGFPEPLLAPDDAFAKDWIKDYVFSFLHRDIQELGYDISLQSMDRLLRMLTIVHGGLLNVQTLSQSLGVTNPTVSRYLDILEGTFLIQRLQPYYVNFGKRLVKTPKIYIRDAGILHFLANVPNFEALQGNTLIGASWEGYVIEQIRRKIGNDGWQFYFYRTHAGAETDLVLISPTGELTCIEIKLSTSPVISKGFYQSSEDLKAKKRFIIIPKGDLLNRSDGTIICSLADFLKML